MTPRQPEAAPRRRKMAPWRPEAAPRRRKMAPWRPEAAPRGPNNARRATNALFLVCGTATSSWAPIVPFAKTRLAVDEGTLGLILLAFGGGSIVTMPLAGAAIHRWGSRRVAILAGLAGCGVLPLLTIAATPALLSLSLFAFGGALGALDVAMNAQAIAIQSALGRSIMSGFHARFSVGGLLGAAVLSGLLRAGVALPLAVLGIAATLVAVMLVYRPRLLPDYGAEAGATLTLVPSRRVVALGALCFISFLAEGAVLDWSAVFLRDLRQVPVSIAGIGYAVFSVAMVTGRLTGDPLTHRLGAQRMLAVGAAVAAGGFLLVAGVPGVPAALAGFVLIGFGAANIVPVLFSASGSVPGVPPSVALAGVTTIAYAGLLLGPALIGFVADWTSLPAAFAMVAALLTVITLTAARVR
jgi:predicted MFS family arabinose efflux permease